MNIFEFAIEAEKKLNTPGLGAKFASLYIQLRLESYSRFHTLYESGTGTPSKDPENPNRGIVLSSSHGIDYFKNVIKYWDNPSSYYTPMDKKTLNSKNPKPLVLKSPTEIVHGDYEQEFVRLLLLEKERINKHL